MRCPTLSELPPPPAGKTGWPWTEESPQLPETTPEGRPWPRISIVTPSFNQGEFIEETIRSVLLQGYPDLEYIIIDGGSTDKSVEIVKKYEPWLSYWVSEPDRGQSDAINKGWKQCTGEIVAYLNSDDVYTPSAISEAVSTFFRGPEYAVVHGLTTIIDEYSDTGKLFGSPFDLISSLNGCNNPVAQPSAFIRRKFIDEVGLMDIKLHRAMDYDLWLRLGIKYPFYFVPRAWSKSRHHSESKTLTSVTLRSDALPILEKFYATPKLPQEILRIKKRSLAWAHLFRALDFYHSKKPVSARYHALRAFILNKEVCLKSGVELFIGTMLHPALFVKMRKGRSKLKGGPKV